MLFRLVRDPDKPSPGPAPIHNFCNFECSNVGTFKEAAAMDTAEHCREQLEKFQKALPLAKSVAEATVLKNLARSWKMIANQMALYEELQAEKKK
jgi:hypothetical protein